MPWLAFATISHASDSYLKMHDEHHGAGHSGHGHHDESSMGHDDDETAQNAEKHRRHPRQRGRLVQSVIALQQPSDAI